MFRDYAKDDMDMLLPGINVKMSWMTFAMIWGPLIIAVAVFTQQLHAAVTTQTSEEKETEGMFGGEEIAMLAIFATMATKAYKSINNYMRTQKNYRAALVKSLYHHQLDVNKGVLNQLHNEAELQIMREALLCYAFLWRRCEKEGGEGKLVERTEQITKEELDHEIEEWLRSVLGLKRLNFEIGEALGIVEDQDAVHVTIDGKLKAKSIDLVLVSMREKWDSYF